MTALPELRYLRPLVILAEERHFGRAAARLGMAQPQLSALVGRLEADLGGPLFHRRPAVALTLAGEILVDAARRLLRDLDDTVIAARRAARGEVGPLTVGFASTVLFTRLPGAIRTYQARFPDVELRLREMHSAQQLEALGAGLLDVAILRECPDDEALASRVLVREPFVAVLRRGHPAAAARATAVAALRDEPFVMIPRNIAPGLHDRIVGLCRAAGFAPRVMHEVREWQSISALVAAGFGVSIAPAGLRTVRAPGVAYRPLDGASERTLLAAVWRRDRVSPRVDALVGELSAAQR